MHSYKFSKPPENVSRSGLQSDILQDTGHVIYALKITTLGGKPGHVYNATEKTNNTWRGRGGIDNPL